MYKVTIINGGKRTVIHHPYFNETKVIAGDINLGINVADKFTFTLLPDNPGYKLITPLNTLIEVLDAKRNEVIFDGRVLLPKESMDDDGSLEKTYICESELGFLNDSAQRHGEFRDTTVREFFEAIIANHNRDVANDVIDKRFEVGVVTVTNSTDNVYRYLGYDSTFDSLDDKLISRLGGELRVRKENNRRYIDYLSSDGEVKETEIRLSRNLKSISKEVDPSDIITRLIPLGQRIESEDEDAVDASQQRLTIASVNNNVDYIVDEEAEISLGTTVVRSNVWDDITLPSILLTRGRQFLQENNRVKTKYQLKALDLSKIGLDIDTFEVANYYPVINPIMGLNEALRVIGKKIDILNPDEDELVIGDTFKTASEYQLDANKSRQDVLEMRETVYRQIQTIGVLRNEIIEVNRSVGDIQITLEENDLPGLEEAVTNLREAVDELNDAIDEIPAYGPVTSTRNGLMISADKTKLDKVSINEFIDLDSVTSKLEEIITGTGLISLTPLLATRAVISGDPPTYMRRNKVCRVYFSLRGFTAEGQTMVTLPVGFRPINDIRVTTNTLNDKSAIITIRKNGVIELTKVNGLMGMMGGANSNDVFVLEKDFYVG